MKVVVCVKQAASLGDEVAFMADGRGWTRSTWTSR